MSNTERVLNFAEQLSTGRANAWTKAVAGFGLGAHGDEDETVDVLEEFARGGPALELAIGSGRIAVPLAARGIRVDGIDNSEAMIEKLRERPGGEEIAVTIGDFADVGVSGSYRLIFLVANTLPNLITQENQVRCFENVAAHLTDDGVFVVEAGMPWWHGEDQYVRTTTLDVDYVALDVARHDPVKQTLAESHVILTRQGVHLFPLVTRYVWPSEMDLMARLAGLHLRDRWRNWNREPYTGEARSNCISVYGR